MPNITVTVSLSHEILVIYITYYVMGTIWHNSESITKSTVSLISIKLLKQWQKLSEVRLNSCFSLFPFFYESDFVSAAVWFIRMAY